MRTAKTIPTQSQIDFAKAIADKLDIPFEDIKRDEIPEFINDNKDDFYFKEK